MRQRGMQTTTTYGTPPKVRPYYMRPTGVLSSRSCSPVTLGSRGTGSGGAGGGALEGARVTYREGSPTGPSQHGGQVGSVAAGLAGHPQGPIPASPHPVPLLAEATQHDGQDANVVANRRHPGRQPVPLELVTLSRTVSGPLEFGSTTYRYGQGQQRATEPLTRNQARAGAVNHAPTNLTMLILTLLLLLGILGGLAFGYLLSTS